MKTDHHLMQQWQPFFGGWVMLTLYLLIFLIPPGRVPHHHHHHDLHAEDTCVKDACHIAIYHPGQQGGCDHKSHLTPAPDECGFCHVLCPRLIPSSYSVFEDLAGEAQTDGFSDPVFSTFSCPASQTARGPPVFI